MISILTNGQDIQKKNLENSRTNKLSKQMDLTNICKTVQTTTKEYTILAPYRTSSKTDHMLCHKQILTNIMKLE